MTATVPSDGVVTHADSASWTGRAWSCTVRLVVGDPRVLAPASHDLMSLLARVDRAASRFRADSELSRANALAGRPVPVSGLLVDLVSAALTAARRTNGAVDPTLGRQLEAIGYDADIAEVRSTEYAGEPEIPARSRDWRHVRLHRDTALLTVPSGASLDLGATAKAWTADHAASVLAARYGTGVLVELGGDLAAAGPTADGWCIRVAEREGADGQLVQLRHGGLATSTTTVRTWTYGTRSMHHVLDPSTGLPVEGMWRTASVYGATAYDANVASTAALVLGGRAYPWLVEQGVAARLVSRTGEIVTTPGWPALPVSEGGPR